MRVFLFFIYFIFSSLSFADSFCRCLPNEACWPTQEDWQQLGKKLDGRLVRPVNPIITCEQDAISPKCKAALQNLHNPFYLTSNPGATQSQGWVNAWHSQASNYAVEAKSTVDVIAAINFAREHELRVVIKGTGHDYLGRSSSANSLLIWTHNMRAITMHNQFIPTGCKNQKGMSAVTIGAGTRWIDAYHEVTTKHHRYVQGGGCTTVGAAGGFTQGGGFGSWSKKFGTGAAGILEAEVVLANGKTMIANQCQNQDLFWAIRGGGGSTFGVITKLTLKTHPLPANFGFIQTAISAKNDGAFKKLIKQFLAFFRQNLNNEHWGEQFSFDAKNKLNVFMVFQGLNKNEVEKVWLPLNAWIKKHAEEYTIQNKINLIPPHEFWDYRFWQKNYPEMITLNTAKGATKGEFWWANNSNEVSTYWYTYQSWWLPSKLLGDGNLDNLSDIFFKASRLTKVTLHANKGLAGASAEAIKSSRETSTHPSVFDAAGLIILGAGSNQIFPLQKSASDLNKIHSAIQKVTQAMQYFVNAAPHAGTYANEADYFQKDWQENFWGKNYSKLFAIKQKYDPDGLFYCHHCIGSELWRDDGMCKKVIN